MPTTNVRVLYFNPTNSADGIASMRFYRKGIVTAIRWTVALLGHATDARNVQAQLNKSTANSLAVNDASGVVSTITSQVTPGNGGSSVQVEQTNIAIPVNDGDVWCAHVKFDGTLVASKFYVEVYVAE